MPTKQKSRSTLLEKEYITPTEVERCFSVSQRKLRDMRREGGGPKFRRVSRKAVLYSIREIERWFNSLPSSGGEANYPSPVKPFLGSVSQRRLLKAFPTTTMTEV
jgi:hypothetical protein